MASEDIYKWLKARKLIKWGALCQEIGIDKSNFQKIMKEGKELKPEVEKKIREVLKEYGLPEVMRKINQDLFTYGEAVTKTTSTGVKRIAPRSNEADILAQIAAIQAEKIPKERDTIMGRKVWKKEQENRVEELKALL